MDKMLDALGLTLAFTLGSVIIVGGIMWLLYLFFNKMPKADQSPSISRDEQNPR